MRDVSARQVKKVISELCIRANTELRKDILAALKKAVKRETKTLARDILKDLVENAVIASRDSLAICQDTGMAVVYLEIGQGVRIAGGSLSRAVNEGVKDGYRKGFLRKSIVGDPLIRRNTGTNAPCVIHTEIIPGSRIRISLMPKGFGSENKGEIRMFNPTADVKDIKDFVLGVVREAGPDACPPLVVGIGIGGTMEKAALLAKRVLLRPINRHNPKGHIKVLEKELLRDINKLGIGPMGLGGKTTALGVNISEFPTHIAGLPVAVNISCHVTRSAAAVL